ncbi:acyl-CoA synthetase [Gordonia amicalis]|uniref:Acyl-CoA synthetase n=1 Tax=Gordonia amicalis TaxID=89053 RepID=A0AAE4R5Q3_9ACTN|nr:acyl-CoA synthetase [Gordonia amicalis]MCZ0915235.1 acyl-CoA synthetase [Gordonia amicalis]MCZ4578394.1 acyl-CoA synthetase [Gordonia amicalis]MCZ4650885.1 acyl-CoA synthetase [Gordonia amicalis]MDJ0452961.1 acyl-CoA synthetase [Gordonia amicalis]MDV6307152.1 acyl-CoA synthetase [Gordonia amicalis]
MVSVTGAVGTAVEQVQDAVGAFKVLRRSGLLDPTRPKELLTTVKRAKIIGPCASVVAHGADEYPEAGAVADDRGELTYGELNANANALANHLEASGVERGSVIGVIARDHRGLLTTMSAAGKAGYRLAMMNTGFGKTQFVEVAEREKIVAMLYDEEFTDLADALPAETLRIVTWVDGERPVPEGVRTLDDIVADGDTATPPEPDEWAGLVILTSGTTGLPKGAQRSKLSPFSSALLLDRIPFPQRGTMVIVSPIFHSTGFALWGVGAALGNKTVVMRRFDPEKTLAALAEHKAEVLVAVPTMLHRMLALGPDVIKKYDTSALRIIVIAGSALSPALSEAVQDTFGDVLYNLYGSTEVAIASVAQPKELRLAPGTVGRPPVTSRLALFDDEGRRISGTNVRGRLFVRNGAPFEGYTDGRNKEIIDGYMSTGDMARFDEHGLLHIDGRDDDMIVSGGENVYPLEVENLLAEHPDIDDVAVIGVDDDEFGKRLRAFIVAAQDANPSPEDIKAHVKANLARYKVPRDVVFVDELPRNPTGKLVRRQLPTGPL